MPPPRRPPRRFALDLTRGFDPTKRIPPPPPQQYPPQSKRDSDALHDYGEPGSVHTVGIRVPVDWHYLLARVDFTKRKWFAAEMDTDESGRDRIRWIEVGGEDQDEILVSFVDLSEDVIVARHQRRWLRRMFRQRDGNTPRLGKDPRTEEPPPPPIEPKPPPRKPTLPQSPQLGLGL